jgi:hypothetical protein
MHAIRELHLLDTSIRSGESGGPFPLPELPMTPGREVPMIGTGRTALGVLAAARPGRRTPC